MFKKIYWSVKKWWTDVLGTRQYFRYLEKEDRRRRLAGQFLTFISITLGVIYLVWHWQHINWDVWYYSFAFFIAELNGLILFSFFSFNAWFLRYHEPAGLAEERSYSVDVFIPVAGEPIQLVRKTVEAALNIDFPNKKIYILDDKESEAYRQLAEETGCGYFARKEHSNAKAGNLNYAFKRTDGDLILALDADQVPYPDIVNKLVGYFKIPKIAFVQTKQNFEVPVGDPFGNTDRIFYNVMQSGKDNDNSAFSCGSGVIYQREALQEIGGFSTWNLVEDVHTSMLLHERGWRSVYYNHPLTKGTAPADIYGVYTQRRQWAADSLRIMFWDNPFFHKGLSFKQKLQYFHLGFVYLVAAFVMPFFFITPILALLVQEFVLTSPVATYVIHRFPYFIAMSMAYGLINYPTPYMKAFQMWTGLFPPFIRATWMALLSRKKKPTYRVNVKPGAKKKRRKSPWIAVIPQQGIIILAIFAMIYGFIEWENKSWDFYILNCIWAFWSIWTMSGICIAAVKKHKWPEEDAAGTKKPVPFFSRIGELVLTVVLSAGVLVFFTLGDMTEVNKFMTSFRLEVLTTVGIEKPVAKIGQAISPQTPATEAGMSATVLSPSKVQPVPLQEKKEETPSSPAPAVPVQTTVAQEKTASPPPPPEKKKEEVLKTDGDWAVQVIAVHTKKAADEQKAKLKAAGFNAYTYQPPSNVRKKKKPWVRVFVGFYASKEDAQKAGEKIRETVFPSKKPYWSVRFSPKDKEMLAGN